MHPSRLRYKSRSLAATTRRIDHIVAKALKKVAGTTGPVNLLKPMADNQLLLASFDGYEIAPNAFGEGFLDFSIDSKDLKKGKLDTAAVEFSNGT